MAERIEEKDSQKLYIDDMVKYSIIVNRKRQIPDIKDGLKPVQRRIIYDMYKLGAFDNHNIKSGLIVGDTMGKYHCHGDSSIYGAMEPLVNWYKSKAPIIRGFGNWGTLSGDSPAAYRYTEACLSKFGYECFISELREINASVDWVDNYSRMFKEPEYLSAKIPILLINGAVGIGVGLSTNIPCHNLVEVCEATRKLLHDPKAEIILAPDHCQPCDIICSKKEIRNISKNGVGKYKLRGKVTIETDSKGYPVIRITSLPDSVNSTMITDKLDDMIANKELPMVKDINDATKETVNIIIQLKKDADPEYVKQVILAKTQVQISFAVNNTVVDGTEMRIINDKQYLQKFIDQRVLTKFRIYCNKLQIATTRYHKLIAYIKVIESDELENITKLLKKQKTTDDTELMELLIRRIKLTDLQAKFLLEDINLKRLSGGYLAMYKAEADELSKKMKLYEKFVTEKDGASILNEIDQELLYFEKQYGSPRVCRVIDDSEASDIPHGTFKVVITRKNFIRKIPDNEKVNIVRGDDIKFLLKVDNTENLLLFDNKGKVFKLPVHKITVSDRQSPGIDVRILIRNLTADILQVYYEPTIKAIIDSKSKHYLTVVTRSNTIKKLDLEDFVNVSTSGLMYSKIKDTDEVTGIDIVSAVLDLLLYSSNKVLRTSLNGVPLYKRSASGAKAMNSNAMVEGVAPIYRDAEYILAITNKGKINKFPIKGITTHKRGAQGINVIKLGAGDSLKAVFAVSDRDSIRILCEGNAVEIATKDIKPKSQVVIGETIGNLKGNIIRCDIVWNNVE